MASQLPIAEFGPRCRKTQVGLTADSRRIAATSKIYDTVLPQPCPTPSRSQDKKNGDAREEEAPPFLSAEEPGRRRLSRIPVGPSAPEEKCGDTREEVDVAAR